MFGKKKCNYFCLIFFFVKKKGEIFRFFCGNSFLITSVTTVSNASIVTNLTTAAYVTTVTSLPSVGRKVGRKVGQVTFTHSLRTNRKKIRLLKLFWPKKKKNRLNIFCCLSLFHFMHFLQQVCI